MTGSADMLDSDLCISLSQALSHLSPSPHDALERRQLVTALLRILSPRHERVIRLHYGIGVPPMAMADIAREFDVTRPRIDMLHAAGIERMRRAARWIHGDEPVLTVNRSTSMPRAWTMPNLVVQNRRFVERLDAARRSPPPCGTPRRQKRRRAKVISPAVQPVAGTETRSPTLLSLPDAELPCPRPTVFAPPRGEASNHLGHLRAGMIVLSIVLILGVLWLVR